MVRRSKPAESFFNFFSPPDPVESDDEDDMEDEELQEASENLEMDYQLGQDLKDRVRLLFPDFLDNMLTRIVS